MFSANKRWTPPRSIHFTAEEGDLGFTLRGNSPVQVHFLDPHCSAAVSVYLPRSGAKLSGVLAGSQTGHVQRELPKQPTWGCDESRVPLCKSSDCVKDVSQLLATCPKSKGFMHAVDFVHVLGKLIQGLE